MHLLARPFVDATGPSAASPVYHLKKVAPLNTQYLPSSTAWSRLLSLYDFILAFLIEVMVERLPADGIEETRDRFDTNEHITHNLYRINKQSIQ